MGIKTNFLQTPNDSEFDLRADSKLIKGFADFTIVLSSYV